MTGPPERGGTAYLPAGRQSGPALGDDVAWVAGHGTWAIKLLTERAPGRQLEHPTPRPREEGTWFSLVLPRG